MPKRRWDVHIDGRSRVVELDRSEESGRCRVRVDGQSVLDRQARSPRDWFSLASLPTEHPFALDGHVLALRVDPTGGYDLIIDGISQRTGRPATQPPWETAPPRAVNVAAALLAACGVNISLQLMAMFVADVPVRFGAASIAIANLIVFLALAWGVRARIRAAWWTGLAVAVLFPVSAILGFVATTVSDSPPQAGTATALFLGPRVVLAWVALTFALCVASAIALLRPAVRHTLTFGAAPPLSRTVRSRSATA